MTVSSLAPRQGELLWDVGLGAGSVAIEWMLCHPSLRAIGIEERSDRAARALRNAAALGTPDLQVVTGSAPEALAGLAAPDAVFIGGGLSEVGVLETVWSRLKPGGRLVANAITVEAEGLLASAFKVFGGELTRVQLARAEKVGSMAGWRAAMPVTQWRVCKP
jgi:precorrin-6B C5,15-methyltransferase / cobalt-precorrin-6B C5,C15-methyltransferase